MIGCTEEYTSVTIRDTSARGKSLYSSFPRKRESGLGLPNGETPRYYGASGPPFARG